MKNLVITISAIGLSSITSIAGARSSQAKELSQHQLCNKFLGLGIVAQTLESICKIDGPVSHEVLVVYEQGGCKHIVPQSHVDDVISDTAEKMKQRIAQPDVGLANFCEGGKGWYHDKLDKRHWFDHDPDRSR